MIVPGERFVPKATTGHNAFRFMVPTEAVRKDEMMSNVFTDDARFSSWAGDEKRILVYPVDYAKQYNVTCSHPEKLSDQITRKDEATEVGKLYLSSQACQLLRLHFYSCSAVHHGRPRSCLIWPHSLHRDTLTVILVLNHKHICTLVRFIVHY